MLQCLIALLYFWLCGSTTTISTYTSIIFPEAIAFDSNNKLFAASYYGTSIKRCAYVRSGTTTCSIAANTKGTWPRGIALDSSQNLYVMGDNTVLKFTYSSSYATQSIFATISGTVNSAIGIYIDSNDNFYYAYGTTIYKCNGLSTITCSSYFSGSLPIASTEIYSFSFDKYNKYMFVHDIVGEKLLCCTTTSSSSCYTFLTISYTSKGFAFDSSNNLYIADYSHSKLWKYSPPITVCPAGYSYYASTASCYFYDVNSELNYTAATEACNANSYGWLVTINDAHENNIAISICEESCCWIGINDIATEGVFVWQHGQSNYTDWKNGIPSNGYEDCVALLEYDWNGRSCSQVFNYICETEPYIPGTISTIAGTGVAGYNGDNSDSINATINGPGGIAIDSEGNVYFTEFGNHRVRRITKSTGIISTYAGTGTQSYSGDGGKASSATLAAPCGLSIDAADNIYIADTSNNRIRKVVQATSIIATIISSALNSPIAVAVDAVGKPSI